MRRKVIFFNPPVISSGGGGGGGGGVVNISLNGVYWNAPVTMPSGWQEYRVGTTGNQSDFLLYDDDTTSPYKIELMNNSTGRNDGKTTGDNSGIIPDGPLTNSLANDTSTYYSLELSGLDNGLTYSILLVGSYSNGWGWYTYYKIGTDERTLLTDNNTSNGITYTGISPSSGVITIQFRGNSGSWGLLNGMVLTEE